jgi:hypothetical protein
MKVMLRTEDTSRHRWLRRLVLYGFLPLGGLVGGALAVRAAVSLTTFSSGTTLSSNALNANFAALNDAVDKLQKRTLVRSHYSGSPVISLTSSAAAAMIYDASDIDTAGSVSAGPTGGWTFTPKVAGIYLIHAQVNFTSANYHEVGIMKNGIEVGGSEQLSAPSTSSIAVTDMVKLQIGDSVGVRVVTASSTDSVAPNPALNFAVVEGPL